MIRLLADAHMSRWFVKARTRLQADFPIIHIADGMQGIRRTSKDTGLLRALLDHDLITVGFDRRTMAKHAGELTSKGSGHAGVILFRRSVLQMDYGKQSRLLVEFWREAADWHWGDRIQYLPKG